MKKIALACSVFATLAATALVAQDIPQMPTPVEEHIWLKQFVGEWKTKSKASMGPGQPDMECEGTITSRPLGGFWVISEMKSEMMGMPINGVQTIGYNPETKKYVGTWVDSMTNHLWNYEGTVDETGKILTLEADGPNFMTGGKTTKFQDIYEFKSKDHIVVSSKMLGEDGKWVTFMSGDSHRQE